MANVPRFLPLRAPARVLTAMLVLLAAGAGSPADAKIAYGVTTGHVVFTFDTSVPNVEISHRSINITKLQPGESELAIDLRPATGQVYMLGSTSRLYVLDPADGNVAADHGRGVHAGAVRHVVRDGIRPGDRHAPGDQQHRPEPPPASGHRGGDQRRHAGEPRDARHRRRRLLQQPRRRDGGDALRASTPRPTSSC